MRTPNWIAPALAAAAFACASHDAPAGGDEGDAPSGFFFEKDAVGEPPRGFTAAKTNGAGKLAEWRVESEAGPYGPIRIARLLKTTNSGQTFNLLLSDSSYPADVEVQVKIRPDSGKEDQGGGVVWRAKDAKSYYVARWNPLENNVRVYTVVDGKRTTLKSADVTPTPTPWHELEIDALGSKITCVFDHAELFTIDDGTFTSGGNVGLWTKADAASSFFEFAASAIRRK